MEIGFALPRHSIFPTESTDGGKNWKRGGFSFLYERVQGKLSMWKARYLGE
jgi:hypothetical protein